MLNTNTSPSSSNTVLVTGATGAVGRHIVGGLLQRGIATRALTRRPDAAQLPPDAEVIQGDLAARLPAAAFAGVRSAFVFPAAGGVEQFVTQAADAGVEHFVVLSSLAAAGEHERDLDSPSRHHHLAVEEAVKATGEAWTILRPGTFANNLLAWSHSLRIGDVVYGPYARSAQAPIHEADIAAVAAVTLTEDGHRGRIYEMTGPQALTRAEQLRIIGEALARDVTYEEISPEAFEQAMASLMPAPIIKMLLDYWSDTVGRPDRVRPAVEEVTGRPARTLTEWAADHAADFAHRPAVGAVG